MQRKSVKKIKIIVIVGPTATGKSDLAVHLARKFNGEVISADSRQVYRGLNIGSGKITMKERRGVPHYLLDVVSPKKVFSAADFKKLAAEKIEEIAVRDKVPIIAGGTGFYIEGLIYGELFPKVEPDRVLRKKLGNVSTAILYRKLVKLDTRRARNIDRKNRQRLIRAIEVATVLGSVPVVKKKTSTYRIFYVGIDLPDIKLKQKITTRLLTRIRAGMIREVKRLHKKGLSWRRLHELGLEYRYIAAFLQGKRSKEEMMKKIEIESWQYAKRQRTWFRPNKKITWFRPNQLQRIEKEVKRFLESP